MTTKQYLNQYWRLTERIRQIDSDIAAIEAEIGGRHDPDGPRGTDVSDPTARLAVRLAALRQDLERIREEAWSKRIEISRIIDGVEDKTLSQLLYDRYILCMRWDDVADDIHYEPSYVRTRLHSRALDSASLCIKIHQNTSKHM